MRKKTTKEFIEESKIIHGNKYDYSKVNYMNRNKEVVIICPKHGEFSQKPSLHITQKCGCPKCSYENRQKKFKKSLDVFIDESNKIHNRKYDYSKSEYINSHVKLIIICPKHGEFYQTPNDHLNGKGCPKCNSSHLENKLIKFLDENMIDYEYQKRFNWLGHQSLDFYLPKYNIAIECQGKQHFGYGGWSDSYNFEKLYELDLNKNELCKNNGIKLIYYSNIIDYDNKKYFFYQDCLYNSLNNLLKYIEKIK